MFLYSMHKLYNTYVFFGSLLSARDLVVKAVALVCIISVCVCTNKGTCGRGATRAALFSSSKATVI